MAEVYWLEWDDENEAHLATHGVTASEARQVLSNRHITYPNPDHGEGRIFLVGETNGGRTLVVSLDPTPDPGTWRPVTGWPAGDAERRLLARYAG